MGRIVEFNANNWEQIHSFNAAAGIISENSHVPIPFSEASTFLESDIIAVYVNTTIPDGRRWRWGGYLERNFRSGLTVGGLNDAAGEPRSMYIGRITTIFFPKITAQYSLRFYFPTWFRSVQLLAWQYTGRDDNSTDIALAQEFANINFKLDQMLG
jgi:hypothetical protein